MQQSSLRRSQGTEGRRVTFRRFVDAGYGPEGLEEKRRKRKALLGQLRSSLDAEEILRDTLGAKNVRLVGENELVHQCPLPFGLHKNDDATGGGAASLNQETLLWNCLSGDTLVKTWDGDIRIDELAGGTARLLDGNGNWIDCPVRSYGEQELWEIELSRMGHRKTVYATAGHRWRRKVRNRGTGTGHYYKDVTTAELRIGHSLPSVWPRRHGHHLTRVSPLGVARGFVYGDGSHTKYEARAYFVAPKDMPMLEYFHDGLLGEYEMTTTLGYDHKLAMIGGLPRSWKLELPNLDDGPSYLLGWLSGYFAADGCVTKQSHCSLSSARRSDLEFVVLLCDRLAIPTRGIESHERDGFGVRTELHTLTFARGALDFPGFFKLPHHQANYAGARESGYPTHWTVRSIKPTGRVETVYCAEVSTTHTFALSDHLETGNCWVCGGGDIFWLVANVLDITIEQAVSELSGMLLPRELSASEFLAELEAIWEDKNQVAFVMPTYSESILRPWRRYSDYFTSRGITEETQKEYQTGVDLRNREIYEKGDVSEWITRPRIVIPHFFGGALRGWQKRKIDDIKYGPKYKSSQGFPRDSTLYGMDKADRTHALVVESPASVLKLRSQGFESIVGTLGSEVTTEQINLLSRFDSVTVLADADDAGRKMTEKLADELAQRTELWIAPEGDSGTDPADRTAEQNQELIDHRVPGTLYGVF